MSLIYDKAISEHKDVFPEGTYSSGQSLERYNAKVKAARDAGKVVNFGHDQCLLLDLDSEADARRCHEQLIKFHKLLGLALVRITKSKTEGHYHFYIDLKRPMAREDRLFWQAALGSDPTRAGLDWTWMREGFKEECFLIEDPKHQTEYAVPREDGSIS